REATELELFDLSDLVRQAREMTKPLWKDDPEKRGILIDIRLNLQKECMVLGQKNQIFQVLVNLLKNAAEAMNEGGEIEVKTQRQGDRVSLEVKDTGVGIPEKDMVRVFTPFFTTKSKAGGGLGLATSQRIIEDHEGHILLNSVVGEGSTFTVDMPGAPARELQTELHRENFPRRALSILVIDDMEATVGMMKRGLEKFGHKVLTALSGEEGLAIFGESTPDLIICDLGMSGMDGLQVGRKIKEISAAKGLRKPRFIILTGWADQAFENTEIIEAGVESVVRKPIDFAQLLKTVDELFSEDCAERSDD
ncbi:ATP-binding protein, partial [Thermodesulfobacteriota bacterium]